MKKLLIIDTATKNSSISLFLGPDTFLTKPLEPFGQTKQIIPFIEDLLTSNELTISQLDGIAVCTGPGLFTGIRVGVMTAKTLSYAANIPLYPFSTFDLFKDKDPQAIIDAKCGRCHLYSHKTKNISLINLFELNSSSEIVYSTEPSSFKTDILNLKKTDKDITCLFSILNKITPISYKEIRVSYPTHN